MKFSYVNGRYLPHNMALVHIEDRGYQFSDGVYEVMEIKNRLVMDGEMHFKRLKRSLDCLDIPMPTSVPALGVIIDELVRINNIKNSYIYLQVTRGVAPRNHPFPKIGLKPSLTIMFTELKPPPQEDYDIGVKVITGEDIRWRRKDIKSISLLANVLAKQDAVKAGVKETWLIDPVTKNITEGSSTNAYIINSKGELQTHPANEAILGGVTRSTVLRLAEKSGITLREEAFTVDDAMQASEAFLTSTTAGILPVIKIDDQSVGEGKPGDITRKLIEIYKQSLE